MMITIVMNVTLMIMLQRVQRRVRARLGLAELGLGEVLVVCDFREPAEVGDDLVALLLGARLDDVLAAGVVALGLGAQLEGVAELDLVGVALLLRLGLRPLGFRMLGCLVGGGSSAILIPLCFFGPGVRIALRVLHVCCLFELKQRDRVYDSVCIWVGQGCNLFGVDKAS